MSKNPAATETKFYTLEEVRLHNGKEHKRAWIIHRDGVYDVSDYLEEHPGGEDILSEWAGKDVTKAFEDFGHSSDAKKIMKSFKIGEIAEELRHGKGKKKTEATVNVEKAKEALASQKPSQRSCLSIITCGLCG